MLQDSVAEAVCLAEAECGFSTPTPPEDIYEPMKRNFSLIVRRRTWAGPALVKRDQCSVMALAIAGGAGQVAG